MSKHVSGQIGTVAALVRSTFLVNAVYAAAAREYGLTQQQGQLLCVLMARPYGMSELGAVLGLAKSSLTGLVDRSERNGLVERGPDPEDSRAVRVALTGQGAELADTFYTETCRRVEELTSEFTSAERDALAALLGRVVTDNKAPSVFMEPE
ncbi:MarR family winged helix-turn-helix transcriptional regulator [Actinoplanes regularis]|uniref:MarR family winged helix-turn-helix transcriptional regulator n=1 Tax=Actinoplanes regularis TaxID=52697 RepID=UPI0024A09FD5|nr:MarR family transcriptional regulator [Actinoplanes regularis]GLW35359.1 MarR family transcriptional regulator [Actinoplanes regularis]